MLYNVYTLNPLVGIIDAFQSALLHGRQPDINSLWPGMVMVAILLPVSHCVFKKAEAHFADII